MTPIDPAVALQVILMTVLAFFVAVGIAVVVLWALVVRSR